jgi:hypothetical protein
MDQEILDILVDYDNELTLYKKGDKNGRFHKFFLKKNATDHRVLPTNDGSVVIGPRGEFVPSNVYLVKYPHNGYYVGPLNGQFRHGFGYRSYADPELVYAGEYNNNQKSGKGKLWSRKEKRWVFDGSWANDLKVGYGEMWKNGVTYKGNWQDDKLDGIGRMDWPSGQVYEGSFARDFRNGEGTMTFPNGDQYVGSWRNGRPHGKGLYQWKSGEVYQGTWHDGVMDGTGEIEYGIPVKGLGSMRMGSVQELNYQLQRPDDWNADVMKSSQFIKSYRESIIPESVKRQLKADITSSVGTAGFGGKPAPNNLNFSYADPRPLGTTNAAPGTYNVSTTGFTPGVNNPNLANSAYTYQTNTTPAYAYGAPIAASGVSDLVQGDKRRVDVVNVPGGVEKIETKVDYLKTAPTGAYTNNPLEYVDPKAAARAQVDKHASGGHYTITTDAVHANKAAVVTTVTNEFAQGSQGYKTTLEAIPSTVPKDYQDYKVTNTYGNYNNAIPSRVDLGTSDTGNLKVTRSDLNSENYAYNANKGYAVGDSNVKRVEYNNGGDTRVVTRIN